jgi:hypothetical protein
MCGRFQRKSDKKKVAKTFEVTTGIEEADFDPGDDLRPQSMQPVIYLDDDGERRIEMMRWGFKLPDRMLFNARSEGIAHANFWKDAFVTGRAIAPGDVIFEWKEMPKGQKKPKYEITIFMYGTWLPQLPLKYTTEILDLVLGKGPGANVEIALGIIDNVLGSKAASIDQFGESAWRTIEAVPTSRVSNTFDWHWGRVAEPLASADPKRFAKAFVGLFASDETWLATDSAQHCLRVATTIDPEAVWSVVGPALLKADKAGMRLRIKLEHWFGELIPPTILLKWAKQKGRKGFLLAAQLMTVKSGAPSEGARLLIREAKNPDEVLLLIFSSLHFGFGAGPLSGLLERSVEPLRILAKDPEPRIRAWAKAQILAEEKRIKRQKLIEEESDF